MKVYDHTRLESVKYDKNKNFATVDTMAVIECSAMIYATGYESHELIRTGIGKLISTYACISEPYDKLPDLLSETVFWNTVEHPIHTVS